MKTCCAIATAAVVMAVLCSPVQAACPRNINKVLKPIDAAITAMPACYSYTLMVHYDDVRPQQKGCPNCPVVIDDFDCGVPIQTCAPFTGSYPVLVRVQDGEQTNFNGCGAFAYPSMEELLGRIEDNFMAGECTISFRLSGGGRKGPSFRISSITGLDNDYNYTASNVVPC